MSNYSDIEKSLLELGLQLANARIELLTQNIKKLEERIAVLESKIEISSKTAAYNPRGITEARDNRTNTGSGNRR